MNEHVAKLYDEAIVLNGNSNYIAGELDVEKFAELIVRECAGVCDDERDSTDSEFGKLVAEGCALKIMEHFGVKE